jgi:branched-chain amino acid transport system ATP-binding protein
MVQLVFRWIRHIRDDGVSVLLVEQNARGALAVADEAYVLETGRIVLRGPASSLAADARVQHAYLGGSVETGQ